MRLISICIILVLILTNCEQSEYKKLVRSELKKNVKNDSLFLNLKFGERNEDYLDKIWELNKKGIISQTDGEYGSVRYSLKLNELEKKVGDINMDFFPRFNDKKRLDKLTIKFSHQGWAPWNKELFSDKLIIKVLDTIKKWYKGNDFLEASNDINNKKSSIFYKIDGDRQFKVYFKEDHEVIAEVEKLK